MEHIPVLLTEVLMYLDPKPNQNFIDATIGLGGHAEAILEKTKPKGRLLAIDWDPETLEIASDSLKKYGERAILVLANFKDLQNIVKDLQFKDISGIIFDLGLSSSQLDDPNRGFSFTFEGPLDMRFNQSQSLTASLLIKRLSPKELVKILETYGDVRRSWPLVKRFKRLSQEKKLNTTLDLVKAAGTKNPKILAPIFQALRIAVNDELNNLRQALIGTVDILNKEGRLAVISFHSGEDRIAKEFFKNNPRLHSLIKKPVIPTEEEIRQNPRSRSAKLRVVKILC